MGPRWLALLCLSGVLAAATAAAVPTQETLVVAKDETVTSEEPAASTTVPDVTTEGPLLPLKLTEMDVRSEVALRYAHTAVVTTVKNPAHRAQEATFRVLLPETAFISGFTMVLDGKSYKAYVKEKEEAKQIYSDAVSHGYGAAHIAAKARDSNQFTVSVNVEPNTTAVFNLTYEELLTRRNGVYNHAVNLHPGVVVPKLTVTVHIKEAQKISQLRVPEVRTGNEIDATEDDAQNSKAVISRGHDDREATITFKPDLEEQRRLMNVYSEKSKESSSQGLRPYDEPDKPMDGVLGQFVVQYDVDRPKDGEILVSDGYFVHFFAPSSLPPLAKHVVFVLDTSGSMSGRKIAQLQEAMRTILGDLNPRDYFSIVEFASSVTVHDLKEADEEPKGPQYNYYSWDYEKPATLLPPAPATPVNVAKAKVICSRLSANGGTNIAAALNVAVDLVNKGVDWQPEATTTPAPTTQRIAPVDTETVDDPKPTDAKPTDAKPTDPKPTEAEIRPEAKQAAPETKATDVAKPEKKDEKNLEPIIIFLTDGDPTVGETDPSRITNRISEKNSGRNKASIFSLAFGEDADRKFLRKISLRNEGFMRHIYEAADAALQLHDFYRQVSSPLLADVKFIYPTDQVKKDSLTKHKFRTFYAGSETVVAGRISADTAEIQPQIIAVCGVDDSFTKKRYEISPKVPVARTPGDYLPLERLWAYLTIKQLLDEKDAGEPEVTPVTPPTVVSGGEVTPPTAVKPASEADKDKEDTPEKKALSIALKYEFVTPLTSLVVVKPNATKAVDAESVDKPNNYAGGYPLAAQHAYSPLLLSDPVYPAPAAAGGFGVPGPSAYYSPQAAPVADTLVNAELEEADYSIDDHDTPNFGAPQIEASSPCTPSPCGANAVCIERSGVGACRCHESYIGDPYEGCRPECVLNTDCPFNRACINKKCADACPGSCGSNAVCQTVSHVPLCTCIPGYTGDPFRYCVYQDSRPPLELESSDACYPSPCGPNSQCRVFNGHQAVCSCLSGYIGSPPNCRLECLVSSECPQTMACMDSKCQNPCLKTCGVNAICKVINHSPICSCEVSYTGDPFTVCTMIQPPPVEIRDLCYPSPCGPNAECRAIGSYPSCSCLQNYIGSPPNCRPECTIHSDCPSNKACMNSKCQDTRPGQSSGLSRRVISRNRLRIGGQSLAARYGPLRSSSYISGSSSFIRAPQAGVGSTYRVDNRASGPQQFSSFLSAQRAWAPLRPPPKWNSMPYSTTPFLPMGPPAGPPTGPPPPPVPPVQPTTASPLAPFHLEDLPWLKDILHPISNDTILFPAKSGNVTLELSRSSVPPKQDGGDATCDSLPNKSPGVCVYVSRCATAKGITAAQYADVHCAVSDKYAGMCCPPESVDKK